MRGGCARGTAQKSGAAVRLFPEIFGCGMGLKRGNYGGKGMSDGINKLILFRLFSRFPPV